MDEREEFHKAELLGREKALKVLNQVKSQLLTDGFDDFYIKPMDDICKWDFELRDNLTDELYGFVEAKDRKFPSDDWKIITGGAQLELKKYELLKEISEKNNIPSFYLCTFTDDKYYIWEVGKCNVTQDERMCNKTTAVLQNKILKKCVYFYTIDSKLIGNF